MLIDISVGSRFHAFDLARELDRHRVMRTLHTGYPAYAARRFGLRRGMLRSVWTHEPLNRICWHLHARGLLRRSADAFLSTRYDRIVARRVRPGASIFVGWSSQCFRSLQRARVLGMTTIVERGSTHVEWQRQILEEERALSGLPAELPSANTIRAELLEYTEADFIAVPTKFVAQTFIERGIAPEKLLVNPYGVNVQRFAAVQRVGRDRKLQVIHVGRCSVRKGVHHLMAAVSRVPDVHVTFVGGIDPGMRPKLETEFSFVAGPIAGDEIPDHYARADVFCLLSLEEGLALVIAQAMASGLPVIVTPNTGAEELVRDGVEGFIVPIRSPEIVAERLRWLQENPEQRLAMGRRARERVRTGFSWADYGDRALANYQRVLASRGQAQGSFRGQ